MRGTVRDVVQSDGSVVLVVTHVFFPSPSPDGGLLLQPFCFKAQLLSGQAKVELIEKVAGLLMAKMLLFLFFFCNDVSNKHQTYVYHCVANEEASDTLCFAANIFS